MIKIKIMKKLLLALLLTVGVGSTGVMAQTKLGHINTEKILRLLPERAEAEKEVEKKAKELQKELEEMQMVYQQKYDQYLSERETLSESIRKIREEDLMDLQQRIQERQMTAEEDLQKLQSRLMEPMIKRVEAAIKKVSKDEKYTYIFDTSVLVYFDGGIDISDKVKSELGITGTAAAAGSK